MLICTPLLSYGSSTVLTSPLLLFREHNIILSPAGSPPIDASACAGEISDRCCLRRGGEGTRLATRAPCSRCATVESAVKDPADSGWFNDGGACALNGERHGGLEDPHVTSDLTKSDFATRSNARCNIRSYRLQQRETYDKNNII
jgi:hypothetical protein